LTDIEVARVHHDARQRIERVLRARGLLREPGDEPAPVKGAEDSLLPFLQAASVQTKVAAGENAGRSIPRLVDQSAAVSYPEMLELPRGALKAERDGYSLHAATRIEAGRRDALEHLLSAGDARNPSSRSQQSTLASYHARRTDKTRSVSPARGWKGCVTISESDASGTLTAVDAVIQPLQRATIVRLDSHRGVQQVSQWATPGPPNGHACPELPVWKSYPPAPPPGHTCLKLRHGEPANRTCVSTYRSFDHLSARPQGPLRTSTSMGTFPRTQRPFCVAPLLLSRTDPCAQRCCRVLRPRSPQPNIHLE